MKLYIENLQNAGCTNGQYPSYEVRDDAGNIVKVGKTCRCRKGCSNTDDVRAYDWHGELE